MLFTLLSNATERRCISGGDWKTPMFDLILKTQTLLSAANNLGCGGEHCPTVAGANASQPRLVKSCRHLESVAEGPSPICIWGAACIRWRYCEFNWRLASLALNRLEWARAPTTNTRLFTFGISDGQVQACIVAWGRTASYQNSVPPPLMLRGKYRSSVSWIYTKF